jgi:hypothetical protein
MRIPSTMRVVFAVEAAKCGARVVSVWSRIEEPHGFGHRAARVPGKLEALRVDAAHRGSTVIDRQQKKTCKHLRARAGSQRSSGRFESPTLP